MEIKKEERVERRCVLRSEEKEHRKDNSVKG
jgi:hypothetical protein